MVNSFTQYLQKALNVACPTVASRLVKDDGDISLCALCLTVYSGETCGKDDDDAFLFVYEADFFGEKTFLELIFKFKSKFRKNNVHVF
jgi:hypothetical protein